MDAYGVALKVRARSRDIIVLLLVVFLVAIIIVSCVGLVTTIPKLDQSLYRSVTHQKERSEIS